MVMLVLRADGSGVDARVGVCNGDVDVVSAAIGNDAGAAAGVDGIDAVALGDGDRAAGRRPAEEDVMMDLLSDASAESLAHVRSSIDFQSKHQVSQSVSESVISIFACCYPCLPFLVTACTHVGRVSPCVSHSASQMDERIRPPSSSWIC
jgi:hypothetical protein